jgi:hypothetical protein
MSQIQLRRMTARLRVANSTQHPSHSPTPRVKDKVEDLTSRSAFRRNQMRLPV